MGQTAVRVLDLLWEVEEEGKVEEGAALLIPTPVLSANQIANRSQLASGRRALPIVLTTSVEKERSCDQTDGRGPGGSK